MSNIPLEERFALQDLVTEYCLAVDKLTDVDALLDLFTDDAVLDFSAIGLPLMEGKPTFKAFYDSVFADMTHHQHYIGNFKIESYDGDTGVVFAYAHGLGRSSDGNTVDVHVRYRMTCVRTANGWKIARYDNMPGMPLPGSLNEIHGDR